MENEIYEMLKSLRTGTIDQYFRGEENEYIEVKQLCDIHLPTGKIVANDPICLYEFEPFSIQVKPGIYPVYIYIYHLKTDQRVAFAEIRFNEEIPTQYEFAVVEKNEKIRFKNIKYSNYGVDSGTGGFMDHELAVHIQNYSQEQSDELFADMQDMIEETYVSTFSTLDYTPKDEEANIVGFSSGWGDGGYISYFGYNDKSQVCNLITCFDVLNFDYHFTDNINVFKNVIDNGFTHNKKIKQLHLDTDPLSGYNHLAVFLRWMSEHHLLSDKLLQEYPALPDIIQEKKVDLRIIIKDSPLFAHRLSLAHFNAIGEDFARKYYVFTENGYPLCVDQYAEKVLGTDKYNSEEYQNEVYLFIPYTEDYYQGLSQYIDEAFEKYIKTYITSSPFKYDETYKMLAAEIHGVKFVCNQIDANKEMKAFELANFYRKKLKVFISDMMEEITSFYGEMSEEDVMRALGMPTIDLDTDVMTYTEHTLDDVHIIDVEFDGIFDEIIEVHIDG